MMGTVFRACLVVALAGAYLRAAYVLLGFVRTLRLRRQFIVFRMGKVEAACAFEPLVLLAMAYALQGAVLAPAGSVGYSELAAALTGSVLTLAGLALALWSTVSWPSIFAGHGVLTDHRLVTTGAYGFVRHPVYLAGILTWLGLSAAFASAAALAVTVAYVIPIYLLYVHSEEGMMVEQFGDGYRTYRQRVPMLLPVRRASISANHSAQ
jgi:protein-S-isoprenylcysteine O-methyltransferase Ste14